MIVPALLGIAGGVAILAAFIPGIPWTTEAFQLRLVVFNAGAIAIVAAVSRRRSRTRLGRAVDAAAMVANAWSLVMVVLSIGRPQFPEPDPEFRFIAFLAGAAMWLTDAGFGALALRDGVVIRAAGIALAGGSVLALLGMDRLELIRGDMAWFVQPLALLGIALNGLGWVLMGLDLLRGARLERDAGWRTARPAIRS